MHIHYDKIAAQFRKVSCPNSASVLAWFSEGKKQTILRKAHCVYCEQQCHVEGGSHITTHRLAFHPFEHTFLDLH